MSQFSRKKVPDKPFSHSDSCKILKADPGVEIQWSEIATGVWQAVCACGQQTFYEPRVDARDKQDPLDPKLSRHSGACELAHETDRERLRFALKTTEKDGYHWVQCAACDHGWQVLFYAAKMTAGPGG